MLETKTVNGFTVEIHYDDDPQNPLEMEDVEILYLARSRYRLGTRGTTIAECNQIEKRRDVIALPVYAYVHSATMLKTGEANPFNCPWDSGRSGVIYVTKDVARSWFGGQRLSAQKREKVEESLRALLAAFSNYLNGWVYYYSVKDGTGEVVDSCGGFYDLEQCRAEAEESAESMEHEDCSDCGHSELSDGYGGHECPNCGHRMEVAS